MARQSNRVLQRTYQNRRMVHDKRMAKAFQAAIMEVYNTVLRNLSQKEKAIPPVKTIAGKMNQKSKVIYRAIISDGMFTGLQDVEKAYGKDLPLEINKEVSREDVSNLGLSNVTTAIQTDSFDKIKDMSISLKGSLTNQFKISAGKQESLEKLRGRIKEHAKTSLSRANRIAQTETTRAFNAGTLEGYKKSTVVAKKEWLTNMAGNPRTFDGGEFSHVAANEEKVNVDKPFMDTGEPMMHPGDPSGSAGNVVNCHCSMQPVIGKIA